MYVAVLRIVRHYCMNFIIVCISLCLDEGDVDGGVNVDEDSHLQQVAKQQLEYEGPEYDIDWEEVKRGEASGMPGKWVGTEAHQGRIERACHIRRRQNAEFY